MKIVEMIRHETTEEGTFGKIHTPQGRVFFSGELPWKENQANISCIPAGRYKCEWAWSPRFKRKLYSIFPVPSRSGIRAHAANFMGNRSLGLKSQLNGCLSLGKKLGHLDGQKAILLSVVAMREFEKLMEYKPFILVIKENYGPR